MAIHESENEFTGLGRKLARAQRFGLGALDRPIEFPEIRERVELMGLPSFETYLAQGEQMRIGHLEWMLRALGICANLPIASDPINSALSSAHWRSLQHALHSAPGRLCNMLPRITMNDLFDCGLCHSILLAKGVKSDLPRGMKTPYF